MFKGIPVGTSWSNDVETTLYRCYRRLYNVVSTSVDHDMPAGNVVFTKLPLVWYALYASIQATSV